MGRPRKRRRRSHGSAWHWKQTDCWYCTLPGTKKRIPLLDEDGQRIRGEDNQMAADMALARLKIAGDEGFEAALNGQGEWLVARVASEYIQYCERGLAAGTISKSHRDNTAAFLNDLCTFCGALPVAELKKGHITEWLDAHATWKSPATRRGVIAIVLAAFNRAAEMYGVPNPLRGLKKPKSQPRLQSIGPEDEQALYAAVEPRFRDFLFAAIHTGLRPFCELARLTADDVEETERGMVWRVYSSKTKKTRKIPVRREVAELARRLMKSASRGSGQPLLRNTKGQPWKPMTGVARFLSVKKKLGWTGDPVRGAYSCYTCRHTFAHRMLSGYWNGGQGCSIETLAELIGDTPKVAFDHYGREWGQHYQDPLWRAVGVAANASTTRKRTSRAKAAASKQQPPSTKTSRKSAKATKKKPVSKQQSVRAK